MNTKGHESGALTRPVTDTPSVTPSPFVYIRVHSRRTRDDGVPHSLTRSDFTAAHYASDGQCGKVGRMNPYIRVRVVSLAVLLLAGACRSQEGQPTVADRPRKGKLDVTFLLTSDTHFGAETVMTTARGDRLALGIEKVNAYLIDQMNGMAGKAYPAPVGGKVARPVGALVSGDLTDEGTVEQWAAFVKLYGLTGADGRLGVPVYETVGNHDIYDPLETVRRAVTARHGSVRYSWDWGDLHVICLGPPEDGCLEWLAKDLAAAGRDRPVVIYFHYSIVGPYSDEYWFGEGSNRKKFAAALAGFNVIGLFHGHFHASGWYPWQGFDVYNVGSAKHGSKDFFVIHVTDDRLTVCSWNYEGRPGWWWFHSKPINAAVGKGGKPVLEVFQHPDSPNRPAIPHPLIDTTTKGQR